MHVSIWVCFYVKNTISLSELCFFSYATLLFSFCFSPCLWLGLTCGAIWIGKWRCMSSWVIMNGVMYDLLMFPYVFYFLGQWHVFFHYISSWYYGRLVWLRRLRMLYYGLGDIWPVCHYYFIRKDPVILIYLVSSVFYHWL